MNNSHVKHNIKIALKHKNIKKMLTQATLRYHFSLIRLAKIQWLRDPVC